MLNEQGVREQLDEVRAALTKMDSERDALVQIEKSLVQWLDLHGPRLPLEQRAPAAVTSSKPKDTPRFKTVGSIRLADAIIRTLRNREAPMHTRDILETARSMGADTNSKDPEKVVEWTIYDIMKKRKAPLKKKKAHYFYYAAPKRTESDDARVVREDPFGLRPSFAELSEQGGSDV